MFRLEISITNEMSAHSCIVAIFWELIQVMKDVHASER